MVNREAFLAAYEAAGRNKQQTANALGVSRPLVFYYVKKYGLPDRPPKYCDAQIADAMDRLGNKAEVARALKMPRPSVQRALARVAKLAGTPKANAAGRVAPVMQALSMSKPRPGKVSRYILTSAQNNSLIHAEFWRNLMVFAEHHKARVLVAKYNYNEGGFTDPTWYPPEIEEYVCTERVRLAADLVFCGEIKISPTAVSPLSGLETYTGSDSCIVPHTKLAHVSVPGVSQAKMMYTTGTVTQRNYLPHKAGQKAEFHHAYSALIVEVDADGDWFVRQLNANDEGTFHDLDIRVKKGRIKTGVPLSAIVWGDIHVDRLDEDIKIACWGPGGMLDALRPKNQVFHDTFDHYRRNHHDSGNAHRNFDKYANDLDNVYFELSGAGMFLEYSYRPWCESYVAASNHDEGFERWLREGEYKNDPTNAMLFLKGNMAKYEAMEAGLPFYAPEWGMRLSGHCPEGVHFLRRDDSLVLHNVELAMHGDKGPNGMRGSPAALVRLGCKAITGHNHSSFIRDGLYVVGVSGRFRMGYNIGPTSWSRTHCGLYENGKRALYTMRGNKWRA